MKNLITTFLFVWLFGCNWGLFAQTGSRFDLEAYQRFLDEHQNINYSELEALYPVAEFKPNAPAVFSNALYSDSVFKYYRFNQDEIDEVETNGFMVTDRIRYTDFGEAFLTIYKRDLPVYVSSDAILHALHMSYSNILSTLEAEVLYHSLDTLLSTLHSEIADLENRYGADEMMATSLRDMDVYVTIPLRLLGKSVAANYPENEEIVDFLIQSIDNEQATQFPLFSNVERSLDFSQFTVRGHYTQSRILGRYFKAMMWLGRTELYLQVPEAIPYSGFSEEKQDSIAQRQTIMAYLIAEAMENEQAKRAMSEIEDLIRFLVGESDNVMFQHLEAIKTETGFQDASSLVDIEVYRSFRDNLLNKSYAGQSILSQILVQDAVNTDGIKPASAFMLLGQRFIIDSYILGNVVFDKTISRRMLPKGADAMFALGNNDALPVLRSEIENFGYGVNLAGLRYLLDSYEPEYWETSFFNLWLNTIRTLNPPDDRTALPEFTQTASWSKKTLSTQMASWAQIRHDNLLYAKQSYTGGPTCEFPFSYVEPNPDFFEALIVLAEESKEAFTGISVVDSYMLSRLQDYFTEVSEIAQMLKSIAQNQLNGVENTTEQKLFLSEMLHEASAGCAVEIKGWYSDLYFNGEADLRKRDYIVADVHTSPFDEQGTKVGWVMHIGTGPLNLAMIVTELADGNEYAFVGPVMSYYETVSLNFKRYTDEEWLETFDEAPVAVRPAFTDDYLVTTGEHYYDYRGYIATSNESEPDPVEFPQQIELTQNYPNPFNAGTVIGFRIPQKYSNSQVKLEIYSVNGQLVETLINNRLVAGNYSARWNAKVASGTYFYRLLVGEQELVQKMLLIK